MSRPEINLFDPSLRPARVLLPARQLALLWGACVLVLTLAAAWESWRLREAAEQARTLTRRQAELQQELKRLATLADARKPSEALVQRVAERERARITRAEALVHLREGRFGSSEGHVRYLRALARQAVPGVWLTDVAVDGSARDIVLRGRTVDPERVADYLRNLGREDVLKGHAFNQLEFHRPGAATATATAAGPVAAPPADGRVIEFSVATLVREATP